MEKKYKYNAFISYRHISPDKEIADKLQKKLENYKPPKSLSGGKRSGGWRVFRDETELPTSSNLSNDIKTALEESEYLIVICSKTTGHSRWCMEEIEYFKQLHNGNNSNIITVVADGVPEKVFPPSLCNELIPVTDELGNLTYQNHVIEPLAANVSGKNLRESLKKLNTEFLRIAAPLLGCGYDNLYNREHKKKVKRLFAGSGIVLALLMLFSVYNSAMLLEINNQKIALAAANEDLQKKTEELNLSNTNLIKSNEDLEKKTKEAENNLAEATKQKKEAEKNLMEAEEQRKIAEKNLLEANKQKKIAEKNLSEANKQKQIAETNAKEAQSQKAIAEENAKEAQSQKAIAEENAKEAQSQKAIAEENAKEAQSQKAIAEENAKEAQSQKAIAEENAKEAQSQKAIAEENAKEAQSQKAIAESNMLIAQENEAKANDANKNLRIKNSQILANQSQLYLENDDIFSAVSTALEALPQDGEDIPTNAVAEYVLATATNAYSSSDKMVNNIVNLSGYIEYLEFSEDGTRLLAADSAGRVYVVDYEKNEVIKAYTIMEAFGETTDYINDIVVDGNDGLVLCSGQLISIALKDGRIKWHYDSKDEDGYIAGNEIVTNSTVDYIFLSGRSSYTILTKDGQKVLSVGYGEDDNYDYNSVNDYAYMSTNGTVYIVRPESSDIHIINQNINKVYPVDIAENDEVMSVGESDDCIFLNIGVSVDGYTLGYNNARMICLNKKDMSVKWTTNYTVEGILSNTNYNTMFEFTHNLENENGEYQKHTGILTVSGGHLLCFDKQTGKLYYSVNEDYEDRILYCAPNTTEYSVKIATPKGFAMKGYLVRNTDPNNIFFEGKGDHLFYANYYTFDKERKFVVHSGEDKFALASENSSEINIYHNKSFDNHMAFINYPDVQGNPDVIVDDGKGTFAAYYIDYVDGVRENYIVIYDTKSDNCKAYFKEELDIETMVFNNNKLLMFDSDGSSKVVNCSGEILEEFNLKEKINSAAGFEKTNYISLYRPYIHLSENNIVLCISAGIYTINLSGGEAVVKRVLSGNSIGNYCISDNFASFTIDSYKDDTTKIAYFLDGDEKYSYVAENGDVVEFIRDSVSSVTNTANGNKIAFISKEGYIGVYSYGGNSITKIQLPPQGEINPLMIKFTPDGNSLIAMCANGRFIKYNADTGEVLGEYKSDDDVNTSTTFGFMDEHSLYIRNISDEIVIIDVESMQKLAEIKDFIKYIQSERMILYHRYFDANQYETGYYNYLTTSELINLAKEFLENKK